MTIDGLAIIIEGKYADWPGGARTLTSSKAHREHNKQVCWFGAELHPDGNEVWFRITLEAIERMKEETPRDRGERLVDALLALMAEDQQLGPELNRFQVRVNDDGDAWLEPYGNGD